MASDAKICLGLVIIISERVQHTPFCGVDMYWCAMCTHVHMRCLHPVDLPVSVASSLSRLAADSFIYCVHSCVIYCDRHPVFSKMVNSQYRDWIVEKFICICVKSAESKLTTHLFLLWVILLTRRDLDRANQLYADSHVTVIFERKWLRLQWRQPWATGCVDVTINVRYFPCRYDSNMAMFVHCICPTCI